MAWEVASVMVGFSGGLDVSTVEHLQVWWSSVFSFFSFFAVFSQWFCFGVVGVMGLCFSRRNLLWGGSLV